MPLTVRNRMFASRRRALASFLNLAREVGTAYDIRSLASVGLARDRTPPGDPMQPRGNLDSCGTVNCS